MSISSEISRISQNVADSLEQVALKGVTVPAGSTSDDLPDLIAQISQGSGGGVVITDTTDSHGGTVRTITATEISGTKQITQNGVEDVTSYAAVNVQVPTSGGTEFIVTLSYNSTSSKWEPDKTFAQIQTAYTAGKTIAVCTDQDSSTVSADGAFLEGDVHSDSHFSYWVRQYSDPENVETITEIHYLQDSEGIEKSEEYSYITPGGTLNITQNGTGIDVAKYDSVNVAVPSSSPTLQAKTNISPTTSSQTITPDSGYDGLSSVQINAMPSGTATAPASISGTSATVSTGTNTLTLTKTVSVTPSVTAGYVSSGTAGNSSVSLTASVTTKAAATITPTKSSQTIASGTYLTGTQTIAAIPAAYQDVTGVTAAAGDVVSGKTIVSSTGSTVNGTLVIQHYYTGSSDPSSSTGVNGDIYLKTS